MTPPDPRVLRRQRRADDRAAFEAVSAENVDAVSETFLVAHLPERDRPPTEE